MRMTDIIEKKRDKKPLDDKEIAFFVSGVTDKSIPDYQISALLMAILLNGMDKREILTLTLEMAKSGDMLDLSDLPHTVDKHSTGGEGIKQPLLRRLWRRLWAARWQKCPAGDWALRAARWIS